MRPHDCDPHHNAGIHSPSCAKNLLTVSCCASEMNSPGIIQHIGIEIPDAVAGIYRSEHEDLVNWGSVA